MTKKLLAILAAGFMFSSVNVVLAGEDSLSTDEKKYLETYGWVVGSQSGMSQLGLTDAEVALVVEGFRKSSMGDKSPSNLQDMEGMQAFLQKKAEAFQAIRENQLEKEAVVNKKSAEKFFTKLDKNPKVKKTESGLYYQVIAKGDSKEMPNEKSVVKIDYVGTLIEGDVFDSSKDRGEPVVFSLERVIPGFREGLQFVGKGGSIKLYVPPELAYGNQDLPGIPPGSTLIFEVDMLEVMPPEEKNEE